MEPLSFSCPRCTTESRATTYGPCLACRGALRAKYAGLRREVTAAEYVPKMNVTPNAVALKQD